VSGFTDHIATNYQLSPRRTVAPRHGALMSRLRSLFRLWRRRVGERRALAEFTDRDLRDLCLTRVDVQNEIAKPFWRE
jgi:uncharacterized protein YjiS (DUF1127 family)